MGHRGMQIGDAVIVDDDRVRGVGFVVGRSSDSRKTDGAAPDGEESVKVRWLRGKDLRHGVDLKTGSESWVVDNPAHVHIDGVRGYSLPRRYMGRNVAKLCRGRRPVGASVRGVPRSSSAKAPLMRLAAATLVGMLAVAFSLTFVHNREQAQIAVRQADAANAETSDGDGAYYEYAAQAPRQYNGADGWSQVDSYDGTAPSVADGEGEMDDDAFDYDDGAFDYEQYDPNNIRGTWCRNDGVTCVKITPQTEGRATPLVLDTSRMGDLNPLPDGQTTTLMGYNYQSVPAASDMKQQLRLITQYSYRIDCSSYGDDSCEGEAIRIADMAVGGTPGVGPEFVQEPLLVTRVGPSNALPVDGLDESNPPEPVAYLIIEPYGVRADNSVSDDTVFYSHI